MRFIRNPEVGEEEDNIVLSLGGEEVAMDPETAITFAEAIIEQAEEMLDAVEDEEE